MMSSAVGLFVYARVSVLFYKYSFCTSGVVLNTGVLACMVFVGRVCSCPGVLAGTWGKYGS